MDLYLFIILDLEPGYDLDTLLIRPEKQVESVRSILIVSLQVHFTTEGISGTSSEMALLEIHDAIFRRDEGNYLSSRGTQGLIISVVFTTLATIFVSARLYTRIKIMGRVESNDWMIVVALVSDHLELQR